MDSCDDIVPGVSVSQADCDCNWLENLCDYSCVAQCEAENSYTNRQIPATTEPPYNCYTNCHENFATKVKYKRWPNTSIGTILSLNEA